MINYLAIADELKTLREDEGLSWRDKAKQASEALYKAGLYDRYHYLIYRLGNLTLHDFNPEKYQNEVQTILSQFEFDLREVHRRKETRAQNPDAKPHFSLVKLLRRFFGRGK